MLELFFAASNVATVITIAAKNTTCAIIVTPITNILPTYIEKTIHHIHANTCKTICLVLISGMCLRGFIHPENDPSAGIGSPVFLSDAASGRMLATAPDTSGDIVRILGHQFGTDLIYFNPSPDFIEVS